MTSFLAEVFVYVGRARAFDRRDWVAYVAWVGLMAGLFASSLAFLLAGRAAGVAFPGEAWMVPIGAAIFAVSIAIDTIGHRTIYREEIAKAEGLLHQVTIFCGISSCVLLCAAYAHPSWFWVPAMVATLLSFGYSLFDEAFHWKRYTSGRADRVEMWSHVGIMTGHGIMMLGWWAWYFSGYSGVGETLAALSG